MGWRRIFFTFAASVILFVMVFIAYWRGWWIPNQPERKQYPVRGIDVSGHQGEIEWARIPRDEVQFAYLKATEGGDFRDRRFAENWRASAAAGLRRGAYHFFTFRATGAQQAANFIATVPKNPQALPPAVDVELWGNSAARPSPREFQKQLSDFLAAIRAHYGCEPVIYTADDFRRYFLKDFPIQRLWIRAVLTTPAAAEDRGWVFWQYSEKGKVPGLTGFVDRDVFQGSPQDLAALATP